MLLQDLIGAREEIAPTRYAEAWDNVGLLVGDPLQRRKCRVSSFGWPCCAQKVALAVPPVQGPMAVI